MCQALISFSGWTYHFLYFTTVDSHFLQLYFKNTDCLYPRVLKKYCYISDFIVCKSRFCFCSSVIVMAKHCGLASSVKVRCIFCEQKLSLSRSVEPFSRPTRTHNPLWFQQSQSKMCWGVRQLCLLSWECRDSHFRVSEKRSSSLICPVGFGLESTDWYFDDFVSVLMRFNTQMTLAVQRRDKVAHSCRKR